MGKVKSVLHGRANHPNCQNQNPINWVCKRITCCHNQKDEQNPVNRYIAIISPAFWIHMLYLKSGGKFAKPVSVILPSAINFLARSLFVSVHFDFGLRGEKRVAQRSASMPFSKPSIPPKQLA